MLKCRSFVYVYVSLPAQTTRVTRFNGAPAAVLFSYVSATLPALAANTPHRAARRRDAVFRQAGNVA